MSEKRIYVVRVWSVGPLDGPHDWLMSDGSIQTMTTLEAWNWKSIS